MNNNIPDIYNFILKLVWQFGNHGFNGECCEDLSLVEFMALKKIRECDNITIQETGNSLNFTKSGASKIIDRLEGKGYVVREISPIDGRVCCVNATTKGIEVINNIIDEYSTYINEMLKEFDTDTIENIKSSLEILTVAVQKHQNA